MSEQFTVYINQVAVALITALVIGACQSVSVDDKTENTNNNGDGENWLISKEQVYQGAGRDEIPSIDNPKFSPLHEISFMKKDELVLGLKIGDEVKAYPHKILNYHEIVNDEVGGKSVAVTFCPLTGSAISWSRTVNGKTTTFGVSGLIYKNNLIAYDRETDSKWSQMKILSVNGKLAAHKPDPIQHHLVEMSWEAWSQAYPESKVLNTEGPVLFGYPYGKDYDSDNQHIIFPIQNKDDRLKAKTLGHGIFYDSSLLVFPIEKFPAETSVINHTTQEGKIVVAINKNYSLAISFYREMKDGTVLEISPVENQLPVIMKDSEENKWTIFGEAVAGPREGTTLTPLPAYNAYWFAWADFFGKSPRDPRIFQGGTGI